MEDKLWIFAVQSYGAQASFDGGETDEDFDQEPVIVGHQYAKSLHMAKEAMADELAENILGYEKPSFYTDDADEYEKLTSEQQKECDEYQNKLEAIMDELQFFELVSGGQHSTLFLN